MMFLLEFQFQQGLSISLWIYASEWHPKASQWEPQVLGNLLSALQNWNHWRVPRQAVWQSEVWVTLPTEHSALPKLIHGIHHWNQSAFDSLGFVVAGLWIYATFSLFTIGVVDSYITVKGKEKYFVGKQWFKCLRNQPSTDVHGQASDSEWSLLDEILINLV